MSRRLVMLLVTLLGIAGIAYYATQFGSVPSLSFAEAASMAKVAGNEKKKVTVSGTVTRASAAPAEAGIGFMMRDRSGAESAVTYSGEEALDSTKLQLIQRGRGTISVSGHSHGDWFHATSYVVD